MLQSFIILLSEPLCNSQDEVSLPQSYRSPEEPRCQERGRDRQCALPADGAQDLFRPAAHRQRTDRPFHCDQDHTGA